jgi:hypothetical protein
MDEAWTIDIRKSRARPPRAIRERLRQVIDQICKRSTRVHRGRGQKLFEEVQSPLWERYADHDCIRYVLNSEHPLILKLLAKLDDEGRGILDVLRESISSALPVEMIYSDFSTHPREVKPSALEGQEVLERLKALKKILFDNGEADAGVFRQVMQSTRMFDAYTKAVEQFIAEEFS